MLSLIFGFLISLCLGSFYVNLIVRVFHFFYSKERKKHTFWQKVQNTLFTPSHCNLCKKRIALRGLFPVLGYFFIKGKCTNCNQKIPFFYPAGELIFGIIFLLVFGVSKNLILSILFVCLFGHLLLSASTDYKFFSLDYENLLFIFIFGFLCAKIINPQFPNQADFFVLIGFCIFYISIWYFYPNGIGFGDVLFSPVFAFLCGNPFWIFYLNSAYFTAICVSFALRKKGKKFRKMVIPMGIYFSLALLVTFFIKIYLGFEGIF